MDNSISLMLSESISDEVVSIIEDFGELGLDSTISDEALNNIPIISTVHGLYKIGYGIREIHNINKLADFVLQMSKGAASEEQKAYYIGKLNSNTKKEINK